MEKKYYGKGSSIGVDCPGRIFHITIIKLNVAFHSQEEII